jgi:hypothetical protein
MATWLSMTLGLLITVTVAGALALGGWWYRRYDRPWAIRYREAGLGRFELVPWEGVQLSADARFHLEMVRESGGPRRLIGVVHDGDQHERQPLDRFPLRTQRLEIERIATGRRWTFEARELPPNDDDFTAALRNDKPRRVLTPLCPPSWSWEGIRIQAPREFHYQRSIERSVPAPHSPRKPVAHLLIAGVYMARPAVQRAAVSDWAFSARASPMLVMRDLGTGAEIHRASLDRIGADFLALVEGLSISPALPTPPPDVPEDDSRREGAPFVVDIGFYLQPRAEPWELGVHAEFGSLRSNEVVIRIHP